MKWTISSACELFFVVNKILNESFLDKEERNIITRAIMGFINCSDTNRVVQKSLEEYDEKFDDSSRKKEIKKFLQTLDSAFKGDLEGKKMVKKNPKLEDGLVVLKLEDTSIKIPLRLFFSKDDEKEVLKNRVILYFLEKSLAPHEGQSWTFGRKMLQRLFDQYKPKVEAFADSYNHCLTLYMSAFSKWDDSPGCVGNFFESTLRPSVYYVNPPYSPLVLTKAVKRILLHLKSKRSYGFLLIVPYWEEEEFWQQLYHSRFRKEFEFIHYPTVFNGKKAFTANITVTVFYLSNY